MRFIHHARLGVIALACALGMSPVHAETNSDKEPEPAFQNASLAKAIAEVSTVISVLGEPYFGCETERPGPGAQRLAFPCEDAHLIQTGDEARAVASVPMARLHQEQNPPGNQNWTLGEYLLAGAAAAVGEAVDDAENQGLQREEQRIERIRSYEFSAKGLSRLGATTRLGLMTVRTIRDVGSCTAALDSALDRLKSQGSKAGREWAAQARKQVGDASSKIRTRCYTPRTCIPLVPVTSHSQNLRYIGRVGLPTMVINCSVQ